MESLSMQCALCRVDVLNTNDFYDSCEKEGLKVDRSAGQVKIPGMTYVNFGGASYDEDYNKINAEKNRLAKVHKEIEDKRAFKCNSCGKIYCLKCLAEKAPNSPSGGKACPECGGSFSLL